MTSAARRIALDEGRHVAMPLGGIGTGNLAIGADGGLRQWQLHNIGNHQGDLPGTFFALRVSQIEPPLDEIRILQATPAATDTSTPLTTDDLVPQWQRGLIENHGGVESTTFAATYPRATVEYHDPYLPIAISLTAENPLIPHDVASSSLPTAMFTFTITNTSSIDAQGWLGASALNSIGYDGVLPITGVEGRCFGGNTNRVRRWDGWTSLLMENAGLDPSHSGAGQFALASDSSLATALPQWSDPNEFIAFLKTRAPVSDEGRLRGATWLADHQASGPTTSSGASSRGRTWGGGLAVPFFVRPGETIKLRIAMAWHFPNRYANFVQFGPGNPGWGPTNFWLGNDYCLKHRDAEAVIDTVRERWSEFTERTSTWIESMANSSLHTAEVEHLASQFATLRSPSCFVAADGEFYGFEGVLGASTVMWSGNAGGSCPLNCTHVWNYVQAVAQVFPELERSMRRTELTVMQAPDGAIPHRVIAPAYLPQLWDRPIWGPEDPALDGQLGAILKFYRELRRSGDIGWLAEYWPSLELLLCHIRTSWDPDSTGVLHGIQPSTHDIDLCGVNTFIGTLWLAALRAAEEMSKLLGKTEFASELREVFERGSVGYDKATFNGEYFGQVLDEGDALEFQWVSGCLADQLIGQWWAHELDLGYLLPRDHVRTALRSIVTYNLRDGFKDFSHSYRDFAVDDESGLLMCTWPRGERPKVPTRYADEVWTGSEYQVAAHCLREGLVAEGRRILDALWNRYDGRRRNPYNEIECGDHYVRSMAGWSVLGAVSGQDWDGLTRRLRIALPEEGVGAWPVFLDDAWGRFVADADRFRLECLGGTMIIDELEIRAAAGSSEIIALVRDRKKIPPGTSMIAPRG